MFLTIVNIYSQLSFIKKLSRKDSLWINVAIYKVLIFSTPSFAEMKGVQRIFWVEFENLTFAWAISK